MTTTVEVIFERQQASYRVLSDGVPQIENSVACTVAAGLAGQGIRYVLDNIWLRQGADVQSVMAPICADLASRLAPDFLRIGSVRELAGSGDRDRCMNEAMHAILGGCLSVGESPMARMEPFSHSRG